MRKIFIFIFILVSVELFAQTNNQLNEMIVECLQLYIGNSSQLQGIEYNRGNTFVCKDGLPLNFPYYKTYGISFYSVDYCRFCSNPLRKQLNKGISTLFVSYELIDNTLLITITKKLVKRINKNNCQIILSDWGSYYYEFSCEKKEWVLLNSHYGGV